MLEQTKNGKKVTVYSASRVFTGMITRKAEKEGVSNLLTVHQIDLRNHAKIKY